MTIRTVRVERELVGYDAGSYLTVDDTVPLVALMISAGHFVIATPPAGTGSTGPGPTSGVTLGDLQAGTGTVADALRALTAAPLPTIGAMTYNSDGTIASDPDGNTYTWNADGTPNTQTKGGVTRTFHWNADGSLASVS